jgi:NADH-quinone oxidoreductase subunit J
MADTLFWIFSAAAVASGIGVLANVRNTINAAVSLVVSMLALAGLYFLLFAQFVALIQVMVYAGAIVVLFLFVIMLLNLRGGSMGAESQPLLKLAGAGVVVLATLKLVDILSSRQQPWPAVGADYGTTRTVGLALYSDYVLAFEIAGVLLFAGIIAAIVIGKRSLD